MTTRDATPLHISNKWGRGFIDFGHGIREGSHAEVPTAWVEDGRSEEGAWTIDELQDHIAFAGVMAPETARAAKAFVAYAECTSNPRWLSWKQPDRVLLDVGDETFALHYHGVIRWVKEPGTDNWSLIFYEGADGTVSP